MIRKNNIRERKWYLRLIALAVAMTLVAVGVPGADAQEPSPDTEDEKAALTVDPFESEAEAYADFVGVSLEEAERRITLRSRLDPLIEVLATEHANVYAGFANVMEPEYGFAIYLAGDGSDAANTLIKVAIGEGLPIDVVDGLPQSLESALKQQEDLSLSLNERGFSSVSIALEESTGVQLVTIGQTAIPAPGRPSDLPEVAQAPNIRVSYMEGEVSSGDALYGGAAMSSCTSGFSVTTGYGQTGLLTAGHCPTNITYQGGGVSSIPLTHQAEHIGYWGDVQWHTATFNTAEPFFYNPSLTYVNTVKGAYNFAKWDVSCLYGKVSGYHCDFVWFPWVSAPMQGNQVQTYVGMYSHQGIGGDSGGPWHNANTAHGIHSGGSFVQGVERDVFSRAAFAWQALGVSVRTY